MPELTPMMKQYNAIKERHNDCLLFFRLGDFYEMFNEDAKVGSRELDLTLTTRDRGKPEDEQTPMCGVPYHSAEAYISRLIQKGYKVAICEQTEDPATAKGLVDRDIVRIVTPGTLMESSMLEDGRSNYLAAVFLDASGAAVCFADASTGEVCARSFPRGEANRIVNELARFAPSEAVLNQAASEDADIAYMLREKLRCMTEVQPERFDFMDASVRVCGQFGAASLDELGLGQESQAVEALGALLSYLTDTQKGDLSHLKKLDFYTDGKYMELDLQTMRNLELLSSLRTQEKKGSLLWTMDRTKTPLGSRLLRSWVSRPLLSPAAIRRRLSAVDELFQDNLTRPELLRTLRGVGDLERLGGKIVYGTANARDLTALKNSLAALPELTALLKDKQSQLLRDIQRMDLLSDVFQWIDGTIGEDPPFSVRDGGMLRPGFDAEVDRLRDLLGGAKQALLDIEARERARTGKKLKVSYNKVFGYYIEIPRAQSEDVPEDYVRKQTLVNGERFVTEELKNLETELLTAGDRLKEREYQFFNELRQRIANEVLRIQNTAALVAQLDVLCSLADAAADQNWVRPEITADGVLEIRDGRHPVVERMQRDSLFVPNDVSLDCNTSPVAIITGPNMAGKSTYMRQTALIVLMAQMGSFVPAKSAQIGIVDRVFTRIGASDDLSAGKSTFMVEMSEVAEILKNATRQSLLILDEIGRGTSTYDGMAVARAVVEFCADKRKLGAKTMFATHYHELTELEDTIPGVKNYNITAKKRGNDLIFLRKIVRGGADDSYGIEVASLAGVPDSVIRRAKAVLAELTSNASAGAGTSTARNVSDSASGLETGQVSLDALAETELTERLRSLDLDTVTPLEALNLLYELRKKVST